MKIAFVVGLFVVSSYAVCFNATRQVDDAEMSAVCTDDDTGMDFQYVDLNKTLESDGSDTRDMNLRMYDAYMSGAGNGTGAGQLEARRDHHTIYWQQCINEQVAGVCSDIYVPTWNGGLSSFSKALQTLMSETQRNDRTYQKPRSICSKFQQGTICVSWADYYHNRLQTAQVSIIVDQCTNQCEQNYNSCLARATTGSKDEYYCVSNRADGCGADGSIRACD